MLIQSLATISLFESKDLNHGIALLECYESINSGALNTAHSFQVRLYKLLMKPGFHVQMFESQFHFKFYHNTFILFQVYKWSVLYLGRSEFTTWYCHQVRTGLKKGVCHLFLTNVQIFQVGITLCYLPVFFEVKRTLTSY